MPRIVIHRCSPVPKTATSLPVPVMRSIASAIQGQLLLELQPVRRLVRDAGKLEAQHPPAAM